MKSCCGDRSRMLSTPSGQVWNSGHFSFVCVCELERSFFQQETNMDIFMLCPSFQVSPCSCSVLVFFKFIWTPWDWKVFLLSEKSIPSFPIILWSLDMCLQLILPWEKYNFKYFQCLKPNWIITIIHSYCHNTSQRSFPSSFCFCPKHIFKDVTFYPSLYVAVGCSGCFTNCSWSCFTPQRTPFVITSFTCLSGVSFSCLFFLLVFFSLLSFFFFSALECCAISL